MAGVFGKSTHRLYNCTFLDKKVATPEAPTQTAREVEAFLAERNAKFKATEVYVKD
ncbi:hypothetical protein COLO4_22190 [Corchorus olitorius]|uniref:Uncharacterized protein n=1 Tax=Corchorus olitorius TaxID=93759 RepID=A0A1R3INM3_9ROSI|nr:hypothetical protein COLO4_22190 [Corchorus olitorius]